MAVSFLSFCDGDAWRYAVDGTIVGRARDRSYKEVVRDGVSIDVMIAAAAAVSVEPITPVMDKSVCARGSDAAMTTAYDEDDPILDYEPVAVRGRGRRGKRRIVAKKYTPKATKTAPPAPTPVLAVAKCGTCGYFTPTPDCACEITIATYGALCCSACGLDFAYTACVTCCERCPPKFKNQVAKMKDYLWQYNEYDEDISIVDAVRQRIRDERAEWMFEWRADGSDD
jgi:hypothetical protein